MRLTIAGVIFIMVMKISVIVESQGLLLDKEDLLALLERMEQYLLQP